MPPSGSDFVAIAAGGGHSLGMRFDGGIAGWGYNDQGQATPPSGTGFTAIAAGTEYSLALRADGSIACWGVYTEADGAGFDAIAAGWSHYLALRADGSIVGWGSNADPSGHYIGQATPPSGTGFKAIAAGGWHSLALRADGSIVGWGANWYGQATPPAGNDFVAIAAGWEHSLALRVDGSIVGWGRDVEGQATPPAGKGFTAISAGTAHSLALRSDGSISGWGDDYCGMATPPSGTDFVAIAAGWSHSLAIRNLRPIAVAGPDQTVCADHTGRANVTLDGSASSDFEGEPLSYRWTWSANGQDCNSTDPSFTIDLPVGTYTFTLVVNDGTWDSEPSTCTVTVFPPMRASFVLSLAVINAKSRGGAVTALMTIPGITRNELDPASKLTLWPFGLEARRQLAYNFRSGGRQYVIIIAWFDRQAIIDAVPKTRYVPVKAETRLTDGCYVVGQGGMLVFYPPKGR